MMLQSETGASRVPTLGLSLRPGGGGGFFGEDVADSADLGTYTF